MSKLQIQVLVEASSAETAPTRLDHYASKSNDLPMCDKALSTPTKEIITQNSDKSQAQETTDFKQVVENPKPQSDKELDELKPLLQAQAHTKQVQQGQSNLTKDRDVVAKSTLPTIEETVGTNYERNGSRHTQIFDQAVSNVQNGNNLSTSDSGAFLDTLADPLFIVKQEYIVKPKMSANARENANSKWIQAKDERIIPQDSYVFLKPYKQSKNFHYLVAYALDYVNTPIGQVRFKSIDKVWKHFTLNTYFDDRMWLNGAFVKTLNNPLFVVRQKYPQEFTALNQPKRSQTMFKPSSQEQRHQSASGEPKTSDIIPKSFVFYKPFFQKKREAMQNLNSTIHIKHKKVRN